MPDNLNIKRPRDAVEINRNQPYEMDYWGGKFGVSEEKLKNAIEKKGPMVKNVKKELK